MADKKDFDYTKYPVATPDDLKQSSGFDESKYPIYTPPQQQYGHLHNILAGLVNPSVNTLNLAPEALQFLLKEAGAHQKVPKIPQMGANKDTLSYLGGELGGLALPFGAASKGIGAAEEGLGEAIPLAKEALEKAPGFLKSVEAGALGGAAGSDPGSRKGGAIGGGIGGLTGEALSGLFGKAYNELVKGGRLSKLGDVVSKEIPVNFDEDHARSLFEDIGEKFLGHQNQSRRLYNNVFSPLEKRGATMNKHNLSKYNDLYDKLDKLNKIPTEALSPDEFPYEEDGTISPRDVHEVQSNLGRSIRNEKSSMQPDMSKIKRLTNLQNATKNSLADFLSKNNANDAYNVAQNHYKDVIVPYMSDKTVGPVMNSIERREIEGQYPVKRYELADIKRKDKDLINRARRLMPLSKEESSQEKLDYLTKLLNGDKKSANARARNVIFHSSIKPGEEGESPKVDWKSFIKKYDSLSDNQKSSLFSQEHQSALDILSKNKGQLSESKMRNLLHKLGGAYIGSHLLGPKGGIAGLLLTKPLLDAVDRGIYKMQPEEMSALTKKLSPESTRTALSPIGGASLGALIGGNQ